MKTVSNFSTEHSEPTCRDGARARRVRPEPHAQNAFPIRVIREIRGFVFGTRLKSLFIHLGVASLRSRACLAVALRSRVLPALIAVLNLLPAGRVTAQTFTTLHSFTGGSDGAYPFAELILSGSTLYGTAAGGGSSSAGTVFAVNTDGTDFTNLHSFTSAPAPDGVNSDGAYPRAGLIVSGNILYGTALQGGSSGLGTVFKVNANGTGFTNLHSFAGYPSDGAYPSRSLILSGNTLYGTTDGGGSSGHGTVFAVHTDGTGFTTLHSFTPTAPYPGPFTNSDGATPEAGLILSGNTLYGTATGGGSGGVGTVFALNTDGTGFTNLHSFTALDLNTGTNSDGATPEAGLILSGNTLYGTATGGGSGGVGTVFALNTDGTSFTTLYSFTPTSRPGYLDGTNSDGAYPDAGLILSGNTLYGTAPLGGSAGNGTVFAVNTDGTGFTNLHIFAGYPSDGAYPYPGLILLGNTLYGTASRGGSGDNGTVFSLSLPLPPAEQINGLIALVQGLGLPSGTANSLVVKLQSAASALDRGNVEAACGNLAAFLNEVNAQTGQKLTAAQASLLIAEATRIRAVLGCN